jgi:hypothetical protein
VELEVRGGLEELQKPQNLLIHQIVRISLAPGNRKNISRCIHKYIPR